MRKLAPAAVIMLLALGLLPARAHEWPGNAPYSVPTKQMDNALSCRRGTHRSIGSAKTLTGKRPHQPVLLVLGTGVTRRQNWGWNYWPELRRQKFEICWVALPSESLGDIQVSSEYVARAIQVMHREAREKIDVLGHSQGGLSPRWAIKWFPSGRYVDDYVALATPNHGTSVADAATTAGQASAAVWQMRRNANFIAALNLHDEAPGPISYTNVYTESDQLVQPVGTQALQGDRTANVLLQELCPGSPVDHLGNAGDALAYRLVLDALRNRGAASVERAAPDCSETTFTDGAPDDAGNDWSRGQPVDQEPPLKPYAR